MDVKSFSCKVRNNISEISFMESILYKNLFRCKHNCIAKYKDKKQIDISNKCLTECEIQTDKIFLIYSEISANISAENKVCLIKCTDKLNFPSEELTCYDKCEESYNNKLIDLKENFYKELDKQIK